MEVWEKENAGFKFSPLISELPKLDEEGFPESEFSLGNFNEFIPGISGPMKLTHSGSIPACSSAYSATIPPVLTDYQLGL